MSFDRQKLARWLTDPGQTWRWNRGDAEHYDAVELRDSQIKWYRWSHETGATNVITQTIQTYIMEGPPTSLSAPKAVLTQLTTALTKRQTSRS